MCKLHSFDSASKTWTERGVTSLRINQRAGGPSFTYRIGKCLCLISRYILVCLAKENLSPAPFLVWCFSCSVPSVLVWSKVTLAFTKNVSFLLIWDGECFLCSVWKKKGQPGLWTLFLYAIGFFSQHFLSQSFDIGIFHVICWNHQLFKTK